MEKTPLPPPRDYSEEEVKKFDTLAYQWWDTDGPLKTLHDMNPVRLACITDYVTLSGVRLLDVGCGGGVLSEACAQAGARVTGIDVSSKVIHVAKQHAAVSGLTVTYHASTLTAWLRTAPLQYDIVTCMELLEHVPCPDTLIAQCVQAVRPGGWVFFSTINRSLYAYLFAILGAEYVLNLLPKGTHRYEQLIRPAELDRSARRHGLSLSGLHGLRYQPFSRQAVRCDDVSINYLAAYKKEGEVAEPVSNVRG